MPDESADQTNPKSEPPAQDARPPSPWLRRKLQTAQLISGLVGLLGTVLAIFLPGIPWSTYGLRETTQRFDEERATIQQMLDITKKLSIEDNRHSKMMDDIRREIDILEKAASKPVRFMTLRPDDQRQLSELRSSQSQLDARMTSLEGALMSTPEKALAVPLLRQQVDNLQDRYRVEAEALRLQVSQTDERTKWFIGIMFLLSIGSISAGFNARKAS